LSVTNTREDHADVAHLRRQIEGLLEHVAREHLGDVPVGDEQCLEVRALGERAHGIALDQLVGVLARDAAPGEFEQHRAREHNAPGALQVLEHAVRVHDHAGDDPCEPPQHVVERDEAVWQNHPLHRGVRDVALVPERDVLERGHGIGTQQAGETRHLLAADRVALVWHRRRALLPSTERLFDLADLGLLQTPNLDGELLDRRREQREGPEEFGVTIALDHL
jgi:hypothetical protein